MVPVINIAQLPKLPGLQQLVAKPAVEEEVDYSSESPRSAGLVLTGIRGPRVYAPRCAPERLSTLFTVGGSGIVRASLGLKASTHGQNPV